MWNNPRDGTRRKVNREERAETDGFCIGDGMRYPKPEIDREEALNLWCEEHSDYAKEQVVLGNIGIVGIVLKSLNLNPIDEDLFQIGMIGLVKTVNTFSPDKGVKFTAYAAPIIRNEILMTLRKKRIIPTFSLDEEYRLDNGGTIPRGNMIASEDRFEELSDSKFDLDAFLRELPEREKEIVMLSMDDIGQVEIAQRMGISQPQVSRILKGIRKKIER